MNGDLAVEIKQQMNANYNQINCPMELCEKLMWIDIKGRFLNFPFMENLIQGYTLYIYFDEYMKEQQSKFQAYDSVVILFWIDSAHMIYVY